MLPGGILDDNKNEFDANVDDNAFMASMEVIAPKQKVEKLNVKASKFMYADTGTVLNREEFKDYRDCPGYDKDEFSKYLELLQMCKGWSTKTGHYIIPKYQKQKRSDTLLDSFELVEKVDDDGVSKYYCLCNMYKSYLLCYHTLLARIAHRRSDYNVKPAFRSISQVWIGNDQRVKLIKEGLKGHRKEAYLVYDHQENAEIVYINKDGCLSCKYHQTRFTSCMHMRILQKTLGISVEEYKEERARINIDAGIGKFKINPSHSYRKVPVPYIHRDTDEKIKYDHYRYDPTLFDNGHFKPENQECINPECDMKFDNDSNNYTIKRNKKATIFASDRAYKCVVDIYVCKKCGRENYYDGYHDHLYNYDSKIIYHHSLLNEKTNDIHLAQGSSWLAFTSIKQRLYIDNGSPQAFPQPQHFKPVWNSFICNIQDWQFLFECPHCGTEPKSVGYDGCVIYVKRHFVTNCINPTTVFDPHYCANIGKSRPSNRYIDKYQLRTTTQRWLQTVFQKRRRDKPLDKLTYRQSQKMVEDLNSNGYGLLAKFITYIHENLNQIKKDEPYRNNIKKFLRAATSNEPITALFHPQINDIFTAREVEVDHPTNKNKIQQYSPVLYLLLFTPYSNDSTLPGCLTPLLSHMAKRSATLHKLYKTKRDRYHKGYQQPTEEQVQRHADFLTSGSYYSATKKRNRPAYSIDHQKYRNPDQDRVESCNKTFAEFTNVTGGIWIIRCLKHSIAVGFHLMPVSEGKNDPFSATFCHWEIAPQVMCGDFNCQLEPYCRIREPTYFENTIFPVDAMHCKSHTECSDAFDGSLFTKHGIREYRLWNDQGVEQRNRVLSRLKVTSAHMRLEQFMLQLRQLLEMDNRRLIRRFKGLKEH